MTTIFLARDQVEALAPALDIETALSSILVDAAQGYAGQAVRTELVPQAMSGLLGIMPSFRSRDPKLFAAKLVCVMPGNPQRGLPAHQGIAALFDGADGRLIGMADAGAITEIRTAALTALATRTLARRFRQAHLVIGGGHQTLPHLIALNRLDNVSSLTIWARRRDVAMAIKNAALEHGIVVEVADNIESAVRGADCVTMITGATQPIVKAEWLKPGSHVNAIGSSTPRVREFGEDLIDAAHIFVDDRHSVLALAGEFVGAADPKVVNLGEVLAGTAMGRRDEHEITLFKSVGIALQDLALLEALFAEAADQNIGQELHL